MKYNFLSILLVILIASSCSGKKATGHDPKFQLAYLINNSVTPDEKSKILNNLLLNEIGPSELEDITSLKIKNKISIDEFRNIFWGKELTHSKLEKFMAATNNDNIDLTQIPKLDRVLISSIINDDISFDQITNEFKFDLNLDNAIQSPLINEIVRIFNRDFIKIVNDDVPYNIKMDGDYTEARILGTDQLIPDTAESFKVKSAMKVKTLELLRLSYFKQILTRNRLINLKNSFLKNREINSNFSFPYYIMYARCGSKTNTVNFNESIQTSLGNKCPNGTQVDLDLSSQVYKGLSDYGVNLSVYSFVRGGYDQNHSEDGTAKINYHLTGKIVIPKCSYSGQCSQFIKLNIFEESTGVEVKINGLVINPNELNQKIVDISSQDATIELSMNGNKQHIGACCWLPDDSQNLRFDVETDFNFKSEQITKTEISKMAVVTSGGNISWLKSLAINQDPKDLKLTIAELIKKGTDEYRDYLYPVLLFLNSIKNPDDSMSITKIAGLKEYVANEIGHNLVLPSILSKLEAYKNTSFLRSEKDIIKIYEDLIQSAVNNEQPITSIRNELLDIGDQSDAAKTLLSSIDSLNLTTDQIVILIIKYISNLRIANQKISSEIDLLNIEQAQLSENI